MLKLEVYDFMKARACASSAYMTYLSTLSMTLSASVRTVRNRSVIKRPSSLTLSTKFVTGGAWALRKSAMLKAEKPTDNRPMKSHKASIPDMLDGIGARNNPEVVLKGGKGNLIGHSRL
jgi:hypothetical protein